MNIQPFVVLKVVFFPRVVFWWILVDGPDQSLSSCLFCHRIDLQVQNVWNINKLDKFVCRQLMQLRGPERCVVCWLFVAWVPPRQLAPRSHPDPPSPLLSTTGTQSMVTWNTSTNSIYPARLPSPLLKRILLIHFQAPPKPGMCPHHRVPIATVSVSIPQVCIRLAISF